mmetsp:Transcript_9956/g.24849  ORF Transcript_9956/g.24849 Transcript_9956/m.24849 type:complete len:267 (+) Transcript_9956:195-995(+)
MDQQGRPGLHELVDGRLYVEAIEPSVCFLRSGPKAKSRTASTLTIRRMTTTTTTPAVTSATIMPIHTSMETSLLPPSAGAPPTSTAKLGSYTREASNVGTRTRRRVLLPSTVTAAGTALPSTTANCTRSTPSVMSSVVKSRLVDPGRCVRASRTPLMGLGNASNSSSSSMTWLPGASRGWEMVPLMNTVSLFASGGTNTSRPPNSKAATLSKRANCSATVKKGKLVVKVTTCAHEPPSSSRSTPVFQVGLPAELIGSAGMGKDVMG